MREPPGVISNGGTRAGTYKNAMSSRMKEEEACKVKRPQQKEKNAPDFVDSFFFIMNSAFRV